MKYISKCNILSHLTKRLDQNQLLERISSVKDQTYTCILARISRVKEFQKDTRKEGGGRPREGARRCDPVQVVPAHAEVPERRLQRADEDPPRLTRFSP